ncbi:hypothetical protein ACEQ8H_004618 [Pleosporales sp. CAS-2024a]
MQSAAGFRERFPRLPPEHEKQRTGQITQNWFTEQRKNLDHPDTNGAAVLSAILPHRRKDRVYGVQAPLLAKKLSKLLGFGHDQKAIFDDWKTGKLGDLGVYTEMTMKLWDGTFKSKHVIPMEQVDQLLVQLAAKYRFSDEAVRQQRASHVKTDIELKSLLTRLESWEAKWLVRLLLRDHCTLHLDENYIFHQYHFLLPDLLLFQNDFDAVFAMLRNELSAYPAAPLPWQEKILRYEAGQKLRPVVGVKVGRPTFQKAWSLKHCFQLVGQLAWAAEVKYDGEYCEIHVDLQQKKSKDIKIFSKNGKDATADRAPLHSTIRSALRIGQPDCLFKSRCIVLGEMVVYSDKEQQIQPFSKIRKHISRSGSFMGTLQDSLPHKWEHLMIVFFDVLVLDDQPILRHGLQHRRRILRDLVQILPGRSMRSEWTLLDFKTGDGIVDLKQAFARNIATRQEGMVLKPLHTPYFPLDTPPQGGHHRQAGFFFIKLKKDYLSDMGGERDLGDFAIIGAGFDPQVAPKIDLNPLHWTHVHLACCKNKTAVERQGAKPLFKLVATLSVQNCIPKADAKFINVQGYVRQAALRKGGGATDGFDVEYSKGFDKRMMMTAFKQPFVVEILGSGFEKLANEDFEMLRHPRVRKLHHDRTWEDCVTLQELERMAAEKWKVPNADRLDGHAKDVALLAQKYLIDCSQAIVTTETTTQTTQRTTQETALAITPLTPPHRPYEPSDATVQETQRTLSTVSSSQCSATGSTQGNGVRASSRQPRILVREDTSERLAMSAAPTPADTALVSTAICSAGTVTRKLKKRSYAQVIISPPNTKRRKILTSLPPSGSNRSLGALSSDSQQAINHIHVKEGQKGGCAIK